MTPTPLHARPANLPEAVKWCPVHANGGLPSAGWTCPGCASGATRPATTEGRGVNRAPRKFAATPTHVDGIRFASKTEAALYEYAKTCGAVVVPHARWPLNCLTSPGFPAVWFTPDLTMFFPVTNTTALDHVVVECWEAKGAKACESRDYALRARAFRRTYPTIHLRVFRKVAGEFVEDPAPVGGKEAK